MNARRATLRAVGAIGALIGYGCLLAFLGLVGTQVYRWLRDGEWARVGIIDGLRAVLLHCCVKDGGGGRLAGLTHWLDAPVDWLGMHKVFEVIPASLALFALSMAGNSLFMYCRDRLDGR